MTTGERVLLTDLFTEDSEGWELLRSAVEKAVIAYFPDEEPDGEALAFLLKDEQLRRTDFTLHGMSLVLHIPAELVYPEKLRSSRQRSSTRRSVRS